MDQSAQQQQCGDCTAPAVPGISFGEVSLEQPNSALQRESHAGVLMAPLRMACSGNLIGGDAEPVNEDLHAEDGEVGPDPGPSSCSSSSYVIFSDPVVAGAPPPLRQHSDDIEDNDEASMGENNTRNGWVLQTVRGMVEDIQQIRSNEFDTLSSSSSEDDLAASGTDGIPHPSSSSLLCGSSPSFQRAAYDHFVSFCRNQRDLFKLCVDFSVKGTVMKRVCKIVSKLQKKLTGNTMMQYKGWKSAPRNLVKYSGLNSVKYLCCRGHMLFRGVTDL